MRGNTLLDKMELIDPAYVEAAGEVPGKRRISRVKWGVAAACLGAVVLAGVFALRGRGSTAGTVTVSIGGITREYAKKYVGAPGSGPTVDASSLEWPWEYKTTVERYTSLELDGREYGSRRRAIDPSLLGGRIGTVDVTGGDAYSDEVRRLACEVREIAGVSPASRVAVELEGTFYVFGAYGYDPPANLGEALDRYSLARTLPLGQFTRHRGYEEDFSLEFSAWNFLGQFTRHRGYEEGGTFLLDDDAYIWEVLGACRDAEFIEDDRWAETEREYLGFTATSEALGVFNHAFYITEDGYIWTNALDYAFIFRIGRDAAGKILAYAAEHSTESRREPYYQNLAGTLTGIEDGYILIDDAVLCAAPGDGMTFKVPLDDLRISRRIDFEGLGVGDLVVVSFTGGIDVEGGNVVEGAFDLNRCWLSQDGIYVDL